MSCSSVGPASGSWSGEAEALAGPACPSARFSRPGSVGPDRRRAAPAADAVHAPVVPGDRRGAVPVPHTVKSQAMSIYRKLGVSSRSQAVTRSRELGLLEGWPCLSSRDDGFIAGEQLTPGAPGGQAAACPE